MARIIGKVEDAKGKAPGDLVFIGSQHLEKITIDIIQFDQNNLDSKSISGIEELEEVGNSKKTSWINIDGVHDSEMITKVGQLFDLHILLLEDVMNTTQRPKFEEFDNCFFLVLKMLSLRKGSNEIEVEHISIVVGKNHLITFQEGMEGDVFAPIRERLSRTTSKVRNRKSDYLAYAIIDIIVDNYISIIESLGNQIENLERKLIENPSPELLNEVNKFKIEINFLRNTIRPVRELVIQFEKSESEIIDDSTTPFLKDLVDHMVHATESIDTYQIMMTDQMNFYQTRVSNKLNEIIRVLTIFSVVFIPLTFIAGVYGTNFEYFPELKYKYSYPIFWALLIFLAGAMLIYFRRKKWL